MHPICPLCGFEAWRYQLADCDGCRVRLSVRMGETAQAATLLRQIERDHGRAIAEGVRDEALRQARAWGRRP